MCVVCNGATVCMETVQMVLNQYQTFHPQVMTILAAKNHQEMCCYGEVVAKYLRVRVFEKQERILSLQSEKQHI